MSDPRAPRPRYVRTVNHVKPDSSGNVDVAGGVGGDHGGLTGLGDDDHPQYLTSAEGNAAYEASGAVATHAGLADPHTGYQKESEKGAASGYASLDGSTKVPIAELPTGTTSTTVSLGDHAHTSDEVGANLVTNGRFRTNQRGYATGTSTASGSYAFDRWKSTTAASTLTFTTAPQGQQVTINSGGSWAQVIERAKVPTDPCVLSWTGTATGRVYNSGGSPPSYAASPIAITPDGTADLVVEFTASGATKTLDKVKLEVGSAATAYQQPDPAVELLECMRFCQLLSGWNGFAESTTVIDVGYRFPVVMRAAPTLSKVSGIAWSSRNLNADHSIAAATWGLANVTAQADHVWFQVTGGTGLTAGRPMHDRGLTASPVLATADL